MRISIHALRGEGDFAASEQITANGLFQSTPSVGRATNIRRRVSKDRIISIHALRGEGDLAKRCDRCGKFYISIHALRGEGDCKNIQICNAMLVHSAYKTIYFCDSCAFYLT